MRDSQTRLFYAVSFLFFVLNSSSNAQVYPRWFLEPDGLEGTAAGYTQNYFIQSSSDSAAYLDACKNLASLHYTKFHGGEAYWETEAGVYWMGDNFIEIIDTSFFSDALSHAKKISAYANKNMTFVLVSLGDLSDSSSIQSTMKCPREEPGWVENIPQSNDYVYAEGVAPQYFYETSSWEAAEKRARFNLARNIRVSLKAIQKVGDQSGQEIRDEEVSETLHDIEVVHRWRDAGRGLFYVLVRMRTN